jgi:hypothetical protein
VGWAQGKFKAFQDEWDQPDCSVGSRAATSLEAIKIVRQMW